MIYKNYKTNYKIFKHPMEKITIVLWNIWTHMNQVLFRKIQPNPFLYRDQCTTEASIMIEQDV